MATVDQIHARQIEHAQQSEADVIDASFTIIESKQTEPEADEPDLLYAIKEEDITAIQAKASGIACNTKDERNVLYGLSRTLVSWRSSLTARKKQLKEKSLAWNRKVDAEYNRLTGSVKEVELAICSKVEAFDTALERAKAAIQAQKDAETKRRLDCFAELEYPINPFLVAEMSKEEYEAALELASIAFKTLLEKRRQEAEAEEAKRIQAEKDEAARVEAIRVEREALARERAELEAEKAKRDEENRLRQEAIEEKQRIERIELARIQAEQEAEAQRAREALEAERAKLQAERDKLAREQFEREEAIRIAKEQEEAKERAEAARLEAERLEAEAKRLELERFWKLKPDAERFGLVALQIRSVFPLPDMDTEDGKKFAEYVSEKLEALVNECEGFGK